MGVVFLAGVCALAGLLVGVLAFVAPPTLFLARSSVIYSLALSNDAWEELSLVCIDY